MLIQIESVRGMRTFQVYNQVLRISHIFMICVSTM